MRKLLLFVLLPGFAAAQHLETIINTAEVARIEKTLSSDEMSGRRVFTAGIDKAADFIATEFRKAGLKPVQGDSYFQEFKMVRPKFISASGSWNGQALDPKDIVGMTTQPLQEITEACGYTNITVGPNDTLMSVMRRLQSKPGNYVVAVDTVHRRQFNSLKNMRRDMFQSPYSSFYVLSSVPMKTCQLRFEQQISESPLKNVVGLLPGKSRPDEYVIFSGHYDHLGIGRPTAEGDSLYNGANDDAAGTTAVMLLANYFAKKHDNERTLVFVAFTAEEVGGYGARYFSSQFKPEQVMAMFNIEMIGTESKWGRNAAYITGYEKSDMGAILQKNLVGSKFQFHPDPYTTQNLFYRSDNATLARLGVPAHTISTSRMEADPTGVNTERDKYYHTADDEFETLDMDNMTEIIRAIAISSVGIIS